MKWNNILNKRSNVLSIVVSVALMVGTIGYMHKRHLDDLEEKITSIYEDRLVAKDYIFDLSKMINTKKSVVHDEDYQVEELIVSNHSIDQLIEKYEKTKLTLEEETLWKKLKEDMSLAVEFENRIVRQQDPAHRGLILERLDRQYDLILADLEGLSAIQLDEGKKLLHTSNQVIASNGITSRLEIALIIVIVLSLLAISTPKIPSVKT